MLAGRVAVQLFLELLVKLVSHREERCGGIRDQQKCKHARVPRGQTNTNRRTGPEAVHGSPSCTTNPTPRTVWINGTASSESTFLRRRVICTSMTLSSGVARRGSFQTSRANISRETRWP